MILGGTEYVAKHCLGNTQYHLLTRPAVAAEIRVYLVKYARNQYSSQIRRYSRSAAVARFVNVSSQRVSDVLRNAVYLLHI